MPKSELLSLKKELNKLLEMQLAFQQDIETVLLKYTKFCTYEFQIFKNIWKELSFSLVYSGKHRSFELLHFTEMCFRCAKKYVVFPKCKFTKIGALYLLYGLYFKQPFKNVVKIKVLKDQFDVFQKLNEEMKNLRQLDAVYIFNKLLEENAFEFTNLEYNLSYETRCTIEETTLSDNTFHIYPDDIYEVTEDALDSVYKTEDKYKSALKDYIRTTKSKLTINKFTLKEDIKQLLEAKNDDSDPNDSIPIETLARKIKEKSFEQKGEFRLRKSVLNKMSRKKSKRKAKQ